MRARKPLTKADLEFRLTERDAKIEQLYEDIETVARSRDKARDRERSHAEKIIELQESNALQAGAIERLNGQVARCDVRVAQLGTLNEVLSEANSQANEEVVTLRTRENALLARLNAIQMASDPSLNFPPSQEEMRAWWDREDADTSTDMSVPEAPVPSVTQAAGMQMPMPMQGGGAADFDALMRAIFGDDVQRSYSVVTTGSKWMTDVERARNEVR